MLGQYATLGQYAKTHSRTNASEIAHFVRIVCSGLNAAVCEWSNVWTVHLCRCEFACLRDSLCTSSHQPCRSLYGVYVCCLCRAEGLGAASVPVCVRVRQTLELPVDRYDSRSSSDSSVSRQTAASPQSALLHRMSFGPPAASTPAAGGGGSAPTTGPLSDESAASEYPYVQFARDRPSKHEYSYPAMEDLVKQKEALKRGGEAMHLTQPPLPSKSGKRRVESRRPLPRRCRHCQEPYDEESNGRGQCEYAPDPVRTCLEAVTCLPAAQCMLYHCCADSEGDFGSGPCACAPREERCARRWLGLTLLAALLPCLCCYPPLAGCYRCCRRCHACGGRHGPSTHP